MLECVAGQSAPVATEHGVDCGVLIGALTHRMCRWPLWGHRRPTPEDARYCGARTVGQVYCFAHASRAGGHTLHAMDRVALRAACGDRMPTPKARAGDDGPWPADARDDAAPVRARTSPLPVAPRPAPAPAEDIGAVLARYGEIAKRLKTRGVPASLAVRRPAVPAPASTPAPPPPAPPPPTVSVPAEVLAPSAPPPRRALPKPPSPRPRDWLRVASPAPLPGMPVQDAGGSSLHLLLRVVCRVSGLSKLDLTSQRRLHRVVRWRHIFMWLARHLTARSLPDIGRVLGGRDHTTILHGIRRIDAVHRQGGEAAEFLDQLRAQAKAVLL